MADSIDTTPPAATPLPEITSPSAAPTSPNEDSLSQDITPEVQDTVSSIDTTLPATAPLSEIVAPSAAPNSPKEESPSQEGTPEVQDTSVKPVSPVPEVQDMSVKPASSVPEVHESDKIQESALASPFGSPKQTGEDSSSEEGEIAEHTVDTRAIHENISEQKSPVIPKGDKHAQVGSGAAGKAPKSLPSLPGLQNSKVRVHCIPRLAQD
jgi:hypothetical protein